MGAKKKGLARGLDAMIPEHAGAATENIPPLSDEQIVGSAVGKVAMILSESFPALDDYHAGRMLRMVMALCQSELKGGHVG